MSEEMLPVSWTLAKLEDISEITMGQSPSSEGYNRDSVGLPFFQGKKEFGELYPEVEKWCSIQGKLARPHDILLSVRAPVGPTNLAPCRCYIGRGLVALSPRTGIVNKYILYAIRCYINKLVSLGTGTTFDAISSSEVKEFCIPIVPTNEQNRIVAKIEELFSSLDAGVAALERVRDNLKRYRASLLKAAVEGRLTAEWRRQNPPEESGQDLLARILIERRRKWEEDQLAAFAAKGKTPPKDWQAKYKEPASPDMTGLPDLPTGWCWASLDAISAIVGGITKGQKRNGQITRLVSYLRVANVQRGYLDLKEIKEIEATEDEINSWKLTSGDILFNEGGDRDKLGRGWIWEDAITECIHQNHVFRARLYDSKCEPKLISIHGNTFGKKWFQKAGKQSVNLASINMTVLKSFPVPVIPILEQQQLKNDIEDKLSILDQVDLYISEQLVRSSRLRQSILKRAFSGKLVPQDPNDEPASELLARIQAERAAAAQAPKAPKPARSTRKTKGDGGDV